MTLPRARAAPAPSTPDLPDAPHTATAWLGMAARRPPGSSTLTALGDSRGCTQGGTVQHTACMQVFCHPEAKPQPPGCQRQCHRQRAALKTPHRGLCSTAIHALSQISPGHVLSQCTAVPHSGGRGDPSNTQQSCSHPPLFCRDPPPNRVTSTCAGDTSSNAD